MTPFFFHIFMKKAKNNLVFFSKTIYKEISYITYMDTASSELPVYTCHRCGYIGKTRQALMRHLEKKNICRPLLSNITTEDVIKCYEKEYCSTAVECEWCKKKFNFKSNLHTHKKTCKENPNKEVQQTTSSSSTVSKSDFEELKQMVKQLLEQKSEQHITYNTTNVQNIQQNNIQVNVNAVGKESLGHLLEDKEKLTNIITCMDIVELVRLINFNADVPENHNVKRITKSRDYYKNQYLAAVQADGKWRNVEKEVALRAIINKGFNTMIDNMKLLLDDKTISAEDSQKIHIWINQNFTNPKQFLRPVFAHTLENEFVIPEQK